MAKTNLISPPPNTPIEHLAADIQQYLIFPDPAPIYTLMGTVAANMIQGVPVWLMLVGPSSCGKTALVNSLITVPKVYEAANITGPSAFLSATNAREVSDDAKGGLLRQVGLHGCILMNDFTSVLSLPLDRKNEIMGVLREAYVGRWIRNVGEGGGRNLSWQGKLTLIGGVTGKIDQYHSESSELGERWMYYRFNEHDTHGSVGFAKCYRALDNSGRTNWENDFRETVREFFDNLNLRYGQLAKPRDLTEREKLRLIRIAEVGSRCRSAVGRDVYSKDREIITARETEGPIRMTASLGQLYIGMDYIGVPEPERWKLVGKVALDSMPKLRRIIVNVCCHFLDGVTEDELRIQACVGPQTIRRTVEDLCVHEVLERAANEKGVIVRLHPWMRDNYLKGFTERGE